VPDGSKGPNGDDGPHAGNGNGGDHAAAVSARVAAAEIRAYLRTAVELPDTLQEEAFGRDRGESGMLVESAEGVTTFGGAAADPTGATKLWLQRQYAAMARARAEQQREQGSQQDGEQEHAGRQQA
jgi:hypothetical protein